MIDIDIDLVRALIDGQFPAWRGLPIKPVASQGWDNRTFRLGSQLSVRLPSAEGYAAAIEKEDRCLPIVAEHLSMQVPLPVATGRPAAGYPFPWSIRRWILGETLESAANVDRIGVARDLGKLLTELREIPAERGPSCGRHSFFRGCHPSVYNDDVEHALARLGPLVDAAACQAIWADALASAWPHPPVWFHGDVAVGNLLVSGGKLTAVIDFGTCGVGDPACDLVMAWTYFTDDERKVFREAVGLPDDTWRRARGWAMWKALVTLAGLSSPDPEGFQIRVLTRVLEDPMVD